MFKIIILSQIGADRYQKLIFEILLLSPHPPLENCALLSLGLSLLHNTNQGPTTYYYRSAHHSTGNI